MEILAAVPAGENVRQPGSDAQAGDKVLEKGTVIGSGGGEVGLLGFVGQKEVGAFVRIAPPQLTGWVSAGQSAQAARCCHSIHRERIGGSS